MMPATAILLLGFGCGQVPNPPFGKATETPFPKVTDEFFRDVGVVRGEVVYASPKADDLGDLPAVIRVDHVYRQPTHGLKKGDDFYDRSFFGNFGSRRFTAVPALTAGELGVWAVGRGDDRRYHAGPWGMVPIRVRKKHDPEAYARWVAWGEAVEKLDRLDAPGQLAAAKKLARSDHPELSAWAVQLVFLDRAPESATFLRELARDRSLTVLAQIAVDELLIERDGRDWRTNDRRKEMAADWVRGSPTEFEAVLAITRIRRMVAVPRDQLLDALTAAQYTTAAATNAKFPRKGREAAVDYLPTFATSGPALDVAVVGLARVLEEEKDEGLREKAAAGFLQLAPDPRAGPRIPFTDSHLTIVRLLLRGEQNPAVAKSLRETLARVKP